MQLTETPPEINNLPSLIPQMDQINVEVANIDYDNDYDEDLDEDLLDYFDEDTMEDFEPVELNNI
jgi:hypothetical protein